MTLPEDFYRNKNVLKVAKKLLGKVLCSNIQNQFVSGIITEVEAYNGIYDKACHAYLGKRTSRTEVMFWPGGVAYVYLCYGIHHLFNVVTSERNDPCAVLIRSVKPLEGIETMIERRRNKQIKNLCNGPGKVSEAFGIRTTLNGVSLSGKDIWIEERNIKVSEKSIIISPRIGIEYAQEDALLPYRYYIKY